MSRITFVLVILACLNHWCAASFQLNVDMPTLPNIIPITKLRKCVEFQNTRFKNIKYRFRKKGSEEMLSL